MIHAKALIWCEELSFVREISYHPDGSEADENGYETFQDEDPRPSWISPNAIHIANRGSKESTEGTCYSGGAKEDGGAHAKLGPLVPARQVELTAGKESGFKHSQEPASCDKALKVPHESNAHATYAEHDDASWCQRDQAC